MPGDNIWRPKLTANTQVLVTHYKQESSNWHNTWSHQRRLNSSRASTCHFHLLSPAFNTRIKWTSTFPLLPADIHCRILRLDGNEGDRTVPKKMVSNLKGVVLLLIFAINFFVKMKFYQKLKSLLGRKVLWTSVWIQIDVRNIFFYLI